MNKQVITEQILQAIWACENALYLKDDRFFAENEDRLKQNLARVTRAFSGSWIGYHANVYYQDFQTPPPGNHFSPEWGLKSVYGNPTSENWIEYPRDDIRSAILKDIDPEFETRLSQVSDPAKKVLNENFEIVYMILAALLEDSENLTLNRIHDCIGNIHCDLSANSLISAMCPQNMMTSDTTALSQGIITPVHCTVKAETLELLHPFMALESLVGCAGRILKYMEINDLIEREEMTTGSKVFIGHGSSPLWRELKDFLQDRLHLEWDEFNRQPTAGMTTAERLQQMLPTSCFAFLVMTAEDQHANQTLHARENVVHEVGLFQGHLGFRKAIILLEEGCSEFSNIVGLSQIRFPQSNISACFEEIRLVLEREGIIEEANNHIESDKE